MKIFTAQQIRKADAYTIKNEPISSLDLMERAAGAILNWIIQNFTPNAHFVLFAGPGNNGGDAWALARLLAENNYSHCKIYLLAISDNISPDSEINRKRLIKQNKVECMEISSLEDFPEIKEEDVLIDALFGSGLSRPMEGMAAQLISHINQSKKRSVISVDIPSGLFCEDNSDNHFEAVVKADVTLSFQFPKFSFFIQEASPYIGRYEILDIGLHQNFIQQEPTNYHFITRKKITALIPKREPFTHKGTFGHGLLIAGSYGMMGAAVLAAKAALRAGLGLLSVHIPRTGYEIMQTAVPESLISMDESDMIFTGVEQVEKYKTIAIGPGINTKQNTRLALKKLITSCKIPLVLDADALNIVASDNLIQALSPNTILTPHPKEFDRLFGSHSSHYQRIEKQVSISKQQQLFIILKGTNTSISTPEGKLFFNTSGNPGMATGGSGDVLTGMLLSLLTQGICHQDSCLTAVYMHGLAGDLAAEKLSEYSLLPTDIINNIGKAFINIL